MTKYILHGGALKRETEANKKFFLEMLNIPKDTINMLMVCFAREKELWEELFETGKKIIPIFAPEKNINFILASENTEKLIEQIKKADIVFMCGGDSHILKKYLDKVPDLEKLWQNKTIAGSSAGALVLAEYFYENDDDTYNQGLRILPFKCFCHYSNNKKDKLDKLENFGNKSEIKVIMEEEFIVINK